MTALKILGHAVTGVQEDGPDTFPWVREHVADFDLVLWTRTGWDPPVPHDEQLGMLEAARRAGVSTVGVHLDRWHNLTREGQIHSEPFFRCTLLATADGGHPQEWRDAGVNHRWFPPAVSERECLGGTYRPELATEVAFVGSWRGYGHTEWTHRGELVSWLQTTYGPRARFWPEIGQPAARGELLRDVYASAKVVVGDSCLVPNSDGTPCVRYSSDRMPETIGRGGFLLHPWVGGVTDGSLYTDGEHLRTWQLGDFSQLRSLIDYYLTHDEEREKIADHGRAHVMMHHTYTERLRALMELLRTDGLLVA